MSSHPVASRRTLLSGALGATALGAVWATGSAESAEGVSVPSSPNGSFYLEMPPIRGESTAENHPDTIQVLDWSFGVDNPANPARGGGGGAGRPTPRPFTAIARSGIHSPALFVAAAGGTRFAQARLFGVQSNGEDPRDYLVITLNEVLVVSYAMAPDSESADPTDLFELAYSRLTLSWIPQGAEGGSGTPITSGFDFRNGRRI